MKTLSWVLHFASRVITHVAIALDWYWLFAIGGRLEGYSDEMFWR